MHIEATAFDIGHTSLIEIEDPYAKDSCEHSYVDPTEQDVGTKIFRLLPLLIGLAGKVRIIGSTALAIHMAKENRWSRRPYDLDLSLINEHELEGVQSYLSNVLGSYCYSYKGKFWDRIVWRESGMYPKIDLSLPYWPYERSSLFVRSSGLEVITKVDMLSTKFMACLVRKNDTDFEDFDILMTLLSEEDFALADRKCKNFLADDENFQKFVT